jgi:hypothetical protein
MKVVNLHVDRVIEPNKVILHIPSYDGCGKCVEPPPSSR